MRNLTLNTSIGNTKLVTLTQFIKQIPTKTHFDSYYEFNQPISLNYFYGAVSHPEFPDENDTNTSYYEKQTMVLIDGDLKRIVLDRLTQFGSSSELSGPPMDLLFDAVMHHAVEFGQASYLVRLDRRTWMVADAEDFALIQHGNKFGLVVYKPIRTKLIKVVSASKKVLMFKPSVNPEIASLTKTHRGRRLNLSDLVTPLLEGQKLCIWCLTPLTGRKLKWCSEACSTSAFAWANPQSDYGLAHLLARQNYACAGCNMDWNLLADSLKGTRGIPMFLDHLSRFSLRLIKAVKRYSPKGTKPEVDHIIPVSKGGQCLGFDNLQGICYICHKAKSKVDNSGPRKKKYNGS